MSSWAIGHTPRQEDKRAYHKHDTKELGEMACYPKVIGCIFSKRSAGIVRICLQRVKICSEGKEDSH